jgi:hypothetical protein
MTTLICHHLEPLWEDSLKKFGTSFAECVSKVATFVMEGEEIERIIITQFEFDRTSQAHEDYLELFSAIEEKGISLEWQEYGYGWELESFTIKDELEIAQEKLDFLGYYENEYGTRCVKGGNHSAVVLVEDWLQRLVDTQVLLCGAFEGECIEDMEIALSACQVNFEKIPSLIVG